MTDMILAAGRALARDLTPVTIVTRSSQGPQPSAEVPRQEWLGAAVSAGDSASIRLVGHKVLAQGAGRAPPQPAEDEAETPSHASRAIASFAQQLGGYTATKGTQVDTYA
ncbi:MAG: hypothetical protein WBF89_23595 [Steroidobacteraceae bacterium]